MNVSLGRDIRPFGLNVTIWGWAYWYKYRWNRTHIDIGPVSVYNLPQTGPGAFFWRIVSIVIKPARMWYHWRFCKSIVAQITNAEWEMNNYGN